MISWLNFVHKIIVNSRLIKYSVKIFITFPFHHTYILSINIQELKYSFILHIKNNYLLFLFWTLSRISSRLFAFGLEIVPCPFVLLYILMIFSFLYNKFNKFNKSFMCKKSYVSLKSAKKTYRVYLSDVLRAYSCPIKPTPPVPAYI